MIARSHPREVNPMSRRSLALFALSLGTLALSACSDSTAPTAAVRQIQPAGQASFDVTPPDECRNGYMTSTGKAC
jgi:hypothetical protein